MTDPHLIRFDVYGSTAEACEAAARGEVSAFFGDRQAEIVYLRSEPYARSGDGSIVTWECSVVAEASTEEP